MNHVSVQDYWNCSVVVLHSHWAKFSKGRS